MLLSSFAIIITKESTLSVTWPFDSSPALYYKWSIVTMRLSCTIMEIWRFKSWTNARTHGRTLRWFYTLSNAMYCIGQTIKQSAFSDSESYIKHVTRTRKIISSHVHTCAV